jgi:hypothetical protein
MIFKIIVSFVDSKQRGRAQFVFGEVRLYALAPFPTC